MRLREVIKRIPVVGGAARRAYRRLRRWRRPFPGSEAYWAERYASGGSSGRGSCGDLAEFKAEVVNRLVRRRGVSSVIEFGSGDGAQLSLAEYPSYLGVDVSPVAVDRCRERFRGDPTKEFRLRETYRGERADLALSLDVIYHLVEDDVFEAYMQDLFAAAEHFVVIYSSDTDENVSPGADHVRHRKFTGWVERNVPQFRLIMRIPNRYPYRDDQTGSFADFYVYERR